MVKICLILAILLTGQGIASAQSPAIPTPTTTVEKADTHRVLWIGDSLSEAGESKLAEQGYTVDAQQNRTFPQGLDILRAANVDDYDRVVMALGTNPGGNPDKLIEEADKLADDKLVLMTIHNVIRIMPTGSHNGTLP